MGWLFGAQLAYRACDSAVAQGLTESNVMRQTRHLAVQPLVGYRGTRQRLWPVLVGKQGSSRPYQLSRNL